MTDKEKMTEIIQKVLTRDVNTIERKAERMTNALIGAGFMSDATRHKWIVRAQELIKGIEYVRVHEVNARNYAFHRAEVAERALFNMTKEYILAKHKIATTKDGQFLVGERMIALFAGDAIKQAEKELAEGRKDD